LAASALPGEPPLRRSKCNLHCPNESNKAVHYSRPHSPPERPPPRRKSCPRIYSTSSASTPSS
jgi:hypothetical protein